MTSSIAIPPHTYRGFTDHPRRPIELLEKKLLSNHHNTERAYIEKPEDLLLDPEGFKVRGQFRLRRDALYQIAKAACPYFWDVAKELSGLGVEVSKHPEILDNTDPKMVVNWLNELIRLRFGRFKGRFLLLDHRTRTVEGLLGKEGLWLPNYHLVQMAQQILSKEDGSYYLQEVCLQGREVVLWYRKKDLLCEHNGSAFFRGLCIYNSEWKTRATSVAPTVVTSGILSGYARGEASQFGRPVETESLRDPEWHTERFRQSYVLAEELARRRDKIANRLEAISETNLGVGGEDHEERMKELTTLLKNRIKSAVAQGALIHAVWRGGYATYASPIGNISEQIDRTLFDLFASLIFCCRRYPIAQRQRAEMAAYAILMGDLRL